MIGQSLRTFILCFLSLLICAVMIGTIWFGYTTANDIRDLNRELAQARITSRDLQRKYGALKADLSHSQDSVRLAKLQAEYLPDLQRPKAFLRIADVPFLSPASQEVNRSPEG